MAKPSKKRTWFYICPECKMKFTSWQNRKRHVEYAHPEPPPPPPPVRKVIQEAVKTFENHRLQNGDRVKIGSKIRLVKEGVVTKLTFMENSRVAECELMIITDSWEF